MTDPHLDHGPSDVAVRIGLNGFVPDPGEHLEALATTGPLPLRAAARAAVALGAHLGAWRRGGRRRGRRPGGLGVQFTEVAAQPSYSYSYSPTPARGGPEEPGPTATRGAAAAPGRPSPRRTKRPVSLASPTRGSTDATRADATRTDATRTDATRADATRTNPGRTDSKALVFPPLPVEPAERQGGGVCEDAAWDRWLSTVPLDRVAQTGADLDREPGRAERAEEGMQRMARRLRSCQRRVARVVLGASTGAEGSLA